MNKSKRIPSKTEVILERITTREKLLTTVKLMVNMMKRAVLLELRNSGVT